MAVTLVVSIGLIIYRSNKLSARIEFDSFFSREFSFLINNWILLGCAFFVLFATMFPTISEALDGSRVTVGIEFFNKWMTPLALVLLLLAGAAPLLAWRKTTVQRLTQQFLFPCALMAVTIVALVVLGQAGVMPRVVTFTPIFADSIQLPVSIINYGLCAFVFGSIMQELYRGTVVRRRQTGSDPFTSLLGLVLSKRRKYGGYVVHLGVAVMFVGFAGKAYDRMDDRTIARPAISVGLDKDRPAAERSQWAQQYLASDLTMRALPPDGKSAFQFAGYTFLYENLTETTDDLKTAVTAQVSIWDGGEHIGTVYPAKWSYRKGAEATSEVAIKVRFAEDVYVVLTGYDVESQLGNFRVFVNPLISWVWIGTLILAFGTLISLIPQGLVDRLSGRPIKTRLGRAAELGITILIALGACSRALASQAHAQAEHVRPGMGMGDASTSYSSKARPQNATEEAAMKELLCPCGCKRESIFICKCGPASDLRAWIQSMINEQDAQGRPRFDLSSKSRPRRGVRLRARLVRGAVRHRGARDPAQQLLVAPAVDRGGRRPGPPDSWRAAASSRAATARRRAAGGGRAAPAATKPTPTDDKYVDKLEDELADTGLSPWRQQTSKGRPRSNPPTPSRDGCGLPARACCSSSGGSSSCGRTGSTLTAPVVDRVPEVPGGRRGGVHAVPHGLGGGHGGEDADDDGELGPAGGRAGRARAREEGAAQGDQGGRVRSADGQAVQGGRRGDDQGRTARRRSR